jgi:hypothetical protein
MENKGVHLFGLCTMIGKERFPVGIVAINVNFEDHYTCILVIGWTACVD